MSRQLLREAASEAGISEDQAEAFVRRLIHPTTQQCERADQCGADGVPPFSWPNEFPADVVEAFRQEGWEGLTSGEYRFSKYARTWRLMCAALLLDEPAQKWASDIWPHPKGDFDGERINAAMRSPL